MCLIAPKPIPLFINFFIIFRLKVFFSFILLNQIQKNLLKIGFIIIRKAKNSEKDFKDGTKLINEISIIQNSLNNLKINS